MITGFQKSEKTIQWLLEPADPGVRYLTLRDLIGLPDSDKELHAASAMAHVEGPIASILDAMDPAGFWMKPGHGYLPKYRSTVWSVILLAQLGASTSQDPRILLACDYLVENNLNPGGQFSATGPPSGTVDCLQGNLYWSMEQLGYENPKLERALDWMARTVTGDGIAPTTEKKAPVRYYAGKYGPGFLCGANNKLACGWGAAKVMLALSALSEDQKTVLVEKAIKRGVDFLFSVDPATAEYPSGYNKKPSRNWWKFGFPVFYVTDLLQVVEALAMLGFGRDQRLQNAVEFILSKQDENGRWALEYSYNDKTWVNFGEPKKPNKWVTLRVLRVLKELENSPTI